MASAWNTFCRKGPPELEAQESDGPEAMDESANDEDESSQRSGSADASSMELESDSRSARDADGHDLSGRDLADMPELPLSVLHLNLYNNRLGESGALAARLSAFIRLQTLVLTKNGLELFPVGLPPSLTLLDLSHNNIREFDATALSGLGALQTLRLGRNALSALPEAIGELTSLQSLDVTARYSTVLGNGEARALQSALSSLPESFSRLGALTSLFLANNQLTKVPLPLTRCAALERLVLTNNALTKLPSELSRLRRLAYLNVAHNCLRELPDLHRLRRLRRVIAAGNPMPKPLLALSPIDLALAVRGLGDGSDDDYDEEE